MRRLPSRKAFYVIVMIALLAIMIGAAVPAASVSAQPAQQTWNLVWADEFNGSSVDTSNWTFETGGGGWGNNELQYYTNGNNATVSGGILTIEARQQSMGGYAYTSTRIKTQGKREFQYGRLEARLAVPMGQGIWPAFWMLGANFPSVGWPASGEIDIMEHINTQNTTYGTLHWDNNGYATYGGNTTVNNPAAFHTYAVEWNSSSIKWFLDGAQFHEANILNNINGTDEFHRPFFFLLNLAVGGNWPGNPDGSTPFPAKYQIDYVRVYQLGTGGTGWTNCAAENGTCSFSGTMAVRYGANGSYFYRTATNSIACNNATFGDPIFGTAKQCDYSPQPPNNGWTQCSGENGTCSFSGTRAVGYGANGAFFYRPATGSIACNNATFGDPIFGTVKACYYK